MGDFGNGRIFRVMVVNEWNEIDGIMYEGRRTLHIG